MASWLPLDYMDRKGVFLEFAHIYADSFFDEEHDLSIDVTKSYLDELPLDFYGVTAILIDDLHIEENTLDVNAFLRQILRRGLAPDHVVFEGRLGPVAQEIVFKLPESNLRWNHFRKENKRVLTYTGNGFTIGLKTQYEDDYREEWSCAILSAAWSLCRAGVFEFPEDSIVRLTEAPVVCDKIVSVLHSKYEGVEAKVQELIRASNFETILPRLDLVFFG